MTIAQLCREIFAATTQEQRDSSARRTPDWLKRVREDIYLDENGRIAYRSQESRRQHHAQLAR